jgi:hypothetical protein
MGEQEDYGEPDPPPWWVPSTWTFCLVVMVASLFAACLVVVSQID